MVVGSTEEFATINMYGDGELTRYRWEDLNYNNEFYWRPWFLPGEFKYLKQLYYGVQDNHFRYHSFNFSVNSKEDTYLEFSLSNDKGGVRKFELFKQ